MSLEINKTSNSLLSIIQQDKEAKNLYSVRDFLVELGYKEERINGNWSRYKEGILQKCLNLASISGIDLNLHFCNIADLKNRKIKGGNGRGDYLFSARLLAFLAMEADSKIPRVVEYRNLFASLF